MPIASTTNARNLIAGSVTGDRSGVSIRYVCLDTAHTGVCQRRYIRSVYNREENMEMEEAPAGRPLSPQAVI
ncbi:hypothetical protein Sp245p_24265 (plasmid) [Azospirillum baldaniorum]|uniref:Uncharacterized protein n=1 Tax=Azospirillum baldaniorum TaxID=1064539 RepID=A0A9P1JZ14_9PROT|nr:hypothetical protein Sp245p_24265 [Azospirillum baldaniorum]CCD02474.1 protein of unknown function [Azospirillum baldaniorum]